MQFRGVETSRQLRENAVLNTGTGYPHFETLDAKIATALKDILTNSNFRKKSHLVEQTAQKTDRLLRGRQIAHMIHEHFRITGTSISVLDFSELSNITLRGEDVQEFDTQMGRSSLIKDDIQESMYNKNSEIRNS